MARRQRDRLTDKTIRAATGAKPRPGMLADGLGLYLAVADSGSASWVYRFKLGGRSRDMGLGSLDDVTLAQARELADAARRKARAGIDPLVERQAAKLSARLTQAKAMTFEQCARAYIEAHRAGWSNATHARQWDTSLGAYVYPIFGSLPVAAIDVDLVIKAIEPIWREKPETASRVRGRIESVLDWATVRKYRAGENPARWRGHLESLLPKKTKVRAVKHFAALPYAEVGGFMADLRGYDGIAARAVEFAIVTSARAGEIMGARWDEIDLRNRLWTVPAERMKARKEHRVPLSDAAIACLERVAEVRQSDMIFPGGSGNGGLGYEKLLATVKAIGGENLTLHGFRSTFSDWAAERTAFPREAVEMALAHAVGNKVEAAYRRGDMFEKRQQLAEAWARHCATPQAETRDAANVVEMRARA